MRRLVHLVRATDREVQSQLYQDGLQAMWEDRWALLGAADQAAYLQRYGQAPPEVNPAQERVLVLRNVKGLCPGIVKGRVRRTW